MTLLLAGVAAFTIGLLLFIMVCDFRDEREIARLEHLYGCNCDK